MHEGGLLSGYPFCGQARFGPETTPQQGAAAWLLGPGYPVVDVEQGGLDRLVCSRVR